jgi:hypothetical protein
MAIVSEREYAEPFDRSSMKAFDPSRLKNLKDKSKDELYGWIERQSPGTRQYTAAMAELARRKQRDDRIRLIVGILIVLLLLFAAWMKS